MNTSKPVSFCVIGCGRLGTALAVFLGKNGFKPAGFYSKTRASAEKAAAAAGRGKVHDTPVSAAKSCDLVFITTPDTRIQPVCEDTASGGGFRSSSTVFHFSGALSSSILASAGKAGAAVGSIHPLQSFAPYEKGQDSPFAGINISIEGSEGAVALGRDIVNSLAARPFTIPTSAKTLYHASAVMASNYLVTLEYFALELLGQAGLDEAEGFAVLEPLIQGTLQNIKARGCVNALTGPVARGDDKIIARHLADMDEKLPGVSNLYREMGKYTLKLASLHQGGLSPDAREKLASLFKSS